VYSSQLDSFREAVSNAFDENSSRISLTISSDKIVIEDWGNGIKDYDEFRRFGQASKKTREGEIIGEKGLGKLSLLNLGNSVCFETSNQAVGIKFYMTMAGFSKPVYRTRRSFVDHVGTRITVTKLKNKIDVNEVVSYLKKTFGLRLAQGAKIVINGKALKHKAALDPGEVVLFRSEKHGSVVTGNLKADPEGKGIAEVYVDHVFVASIEVDTRRGFGGWVNCNLLTPETSRNNIIQDSIYNEFINGLRKYVSRFPFKEIAVDQHKLLLSKELSALLKKYMKDMKINIGNIQGLMIDAPGRQVKRLPRTIGDAKRNPNNLSEGSGGTYPNLPSHYDGKSKPTRTKQGDDNNAGEAASLNTIHWEYAELGNEKGPMHFVPPNVVYCNTSNDLFRFAMMKSSSYGPKWIRLLPYLARIAVEINVGPLRLSPDQFNSKVDDATRYFLKQKKILST
jgi:hypothetical protein